MTCRQAFAVALLVFAASSSGCATQFVKYPNLLNPGTIRQQRYEAAIWDPYPDSSMGPAVIGARPREYMQQVPQAERAQIWSEMFWGPRPGP
jgi:hypothetical protein